MTIDDKTERPFTASQYAYNKVKKWILSGQLSAGDRIDQDEIARKMGLSRMPVRSALDRLSSEGLVVSHPHRGITVVPLSPEHLNDLYLIRCLMEGLAVFLAAERATDEDVEALTRMLDGAAAPSQDIDAAMAENWKFHRYIYEMSGSEVLARQIESFWEQTERYRRIYIGQPGTRDGTDREHRELVSLIASHDAQRAADFQIRNNRRTQRAVLESMNETLPTEKIRLVSAAENAAFLRWKSGRGQAE